MTIIFSANKVILQLIKKEKLLEEAFYKHEFVYFEYYYEIRSG